MKSIIALGTVALCGTLLADISSANIVGYDSYTKVVANETYGSMFITPGSTTGRYKLYDMQIVGTLGTANKKLNYIQLIKPTSLVLDSTQAYYWEPKTETGGGFWAYKNAGPNKEPSGTKVPEDVDFAVGTGFLVHFGNNVKLQFAGEVMKPEMDDEGYFVISKPVISGVTSKNFFVCNPFPAPVTLADMYINGSLGTANKKLNYIQKMQAGSLVFDSVKQYYWEPKTATADGFWAYKTKGPNGEASGTAVANPEEIVIKPGEGFFCSFGNAVTLRIKVPESIKNL